MTKKNEVIKYNNIGSPATNTFATKAVKPRKIETKVIKYEGEGNVLKVSSMTHMSLPFFTKRKKGRGVNFVYDIGFLGLTMKCSLSSDSDLEIQQPGEFEEKIYDYLIQTLYFLYKKNEIKDIKNFVRDTVIEFEVKDLINSLGLKQSNSYADKVSKALANLKNTTYSFERKNVAKSKKKILEFEHEKFSLINYERISIGRKHNYRVRVDNPIAIEAFEKNLIMHFTDHSVKRLSEKSNIPERIYKFIAMNRFNRDEDEVSVVELACIVPYELGGVHIVKGKEYNRDRTKEVIGKLKKNFEVMVKTGYIRNFEVINNEKFQYSFCNEKLGLVTNLTLEKHYKAVKAIDDKKEKRKKKSIGVEEPNSEIAVKGTNCSLEKAIEKVRRNRFADSAWNKRVDNKIDKITKEQGEEYAIRILGAVYHNLKTPVSKTLVQYINGIMKKTPVGEQPKLKKTDEKTTLAKKVINEVEATIVEDGKPKSMKDLLGVQTTLGDVGTAEVIEADVVEVKKDDREDPLFNSLYDGALARIELTKKGKEKEMLLKTIKSMSTVNAILEFTKGL